MTYRQAVYAVLESVKKSFDDADYGVPMVLFWIQVVANRMIAKAIQESGDQVGGHYLTRFCGVDVNVDSKGQKYIELPAEILAMDNDAAIDTIALSINSKCKRPGFTMKPWSRTTVTKAWTTVDNGFESASPRNPYFYTVVDACADGPKKVLAYALGYECVEIDKVDMFLITGANMSNVCDLDDVIPIDAEDEPFLIQDAMRLIRYTSIFPEDRRNDGEDTAAEDQSYIPTQARVGDDQAQ
jgi:hypothetical protein